MNDNIQTLLFRCWIFLQKNSIRCLLFLLCSGCVCITSLHLNAVYAQVKDGAKEVSAKDVAPVTKKTEGIMVDGQGDEVRLASPLVWSR